MTRPQPSHEIRKLTIVLPAHVIKRLVTREALGVPNRYGMGYDSGMPPHPGNHGITPHQYGS